MSKPPRWMTPGAHQKYTAEGQAISIALCGNAAEIVPELVKRGVRPDMVTDQTSAHDPLHGYLPKGWSWEEYQQKAEPTRRALFWRRNARWPITCRRCWPSMRWGPNLRLRQQHPPDGAGSGRQQRLRFPGLRAGLYPPAVLPRYRPVPLGSAVRRSAGYLQNRRESERDH
ncbi:hypothetical protein J4730_10900 [Klebsiella pneumoniae]|uniref:Urocanase Rossmann-like domain-containing protein n=1 Tax=Klebsiella pneumoniae TaxID=573 RepID=A0A939NS19_KLEPN|nr:hypothetical protein [Klebsiella pneumoniae]